MPVQWCRRPNKKPGDLVISHGYPDQTGQAGDLDLARPVILCRIFWAVLFDQILGNFDCLCLGPGD